MVFKSKSGYICGAYSPCLWQQNINKHVKDEVGSSFLFSETHNQIYPLKSDKKQYAIFCYSTYGPTFGDSNCDIHIKSNFTDGNESFTSGCYEYEQYKIENKGTHLFGQSKPCVVECEIYEIN